MVTILRRNLPLTTLALSALVLAALTVEAESPEQAARAETAAPAGATPELCALLDQPNQRGRMDGILRALLVGCGRAHELGRVRQSSALEVSGLEGAGTADVAVSNPAGDIGVNSHTQSETSIARNETTGTLCAGFNDSYHQAANNAGNQGFARSTDGGATFVDRGPLGAPAGSDPSVVWRKTDGFFYYAALTNDLTGIRIWRSTDDCQTFASVGLAHSGSGDDKQLLAVDNNPASSFFGRLYLVWTDFNVGRIVAAFSANGGTTWSTPVNLSAISDSQGAWPTVAPNGDVYAAWVRWDPFPDGPITIDVARSQNGGVSWSLVTSPKANAHGPRDSSASSTCLRPALNGNIRLLPGPQIAVGSDGVLHVVYVYDPNGFGVGDVIDVFYKRSTNNGSSWSSEVKINDDATTRDQFNPSLSVSGANIVSVTYTDRRLDPNNLLLDTYNRLSLDGGLTWQPSQRLSDVSTPVYLDPELADCYHGDYDTQIQTPSHVVSLWSDDRNLQGGHNDPDVFAGRVEASTDYLILVDPLLRKVCAPANALFDVDLPQFLGFTEPVTLSASGLSVGLGASFAMNPVSPPNSTTMTVSGTGAVAAGVHNFAVNGLSSPSAIGHSFNVGVQVFNQLPPAPNPTAPANGAVDVVALPTFSWSSAAQADFYEYQVATTNTFSALVTSGTSSATNANLNIALQSLTTYFWRVRAVNSCGNGAWSSVFSFTVRPIPPILLIDDDDNLPNVRETYTLTLDAIGAAYDLWDTGNSDNEPSAVQLAPYRIVIWFTGHEFGGFAGPGTASAAVLQSWLPGRCLFLSAQDYLFDRTLTTFAITHLGVSGFNESILQTSATGQNVFAGLGPYALSFPFGNFSDILTVGAGAQVAFSGNLGTLGISKIGSGRTVFFAFPFEALPTAPARFAVLQTVLDFCEAGPFFADGFESGNTSAWSLQVP